MGAAAASLCGLAVIAITLQDAFEVVLLPRRVPRRIRFTSLFLRFGWAAWRRLARLTPGGPARERFLSIFGPLAMLALFTAWAIGLMAGFGLIQWAAEGAPAGGRQGLPAELYLSGVTFFTLGYGDITPAAPLAKLAAVAEAGVGFGLIAIVIGYLPVLYQLFSRREAHVLQLDARAGSPPTAAVLIRRHVGEGGARQLDELFRAWEVWGAELLESHLSYPMLAYYRSQHDDQSWLAAMAAVLDACTLTLVGIEGARPLQARMTFAILRQVVVEMARSLRARPSRERADVELPGYEALLELFAQGGVAWRAGAETQETLAAMRATYAPLVIGLSDHLLLPLPGLAPAHDAPDHWDQGPRGLIARRLVEGLAEGDLAPAMGVSPRRRGRSFAARLRQRLR